MRFALSPIFLVLCRCILLGCSLTATASFADGRIDREALVGRHNPSVRRVDFSAPLSVGNGGFAFTVDATGLQTFGEDAWKAGIPLETLSRWAWSVDPNPAGYTLADAEEPYRRADGGILKLPTKLNSPAATWLRRNPHDQPLVRIALDWRKPDGTEFMPADVTGIDQILDLWSGIIVSHFKLGGHEVTVTTACAPDADVLALAIDSTLVATGDLGIRVSFPRGHDLAVKNTPPLDWSHPEGHVSKLVDPVTVERELPGLSYRVRSTVPLTPGAGPHDFLLHPQGRNRMEVSLAFSRTDRDCRPSNVDDVLAASRRHWASFWQQAAALDLSGSTDPRAGKLEERVVLSQYLTAIQGAGEVPPQETGLTCSSWFGKHHTEMIWWHAAHFALWGHPELLEKNLDWYRSRLPEARDLARSRGLHGARWAKMVGPDLRESPGGNALIICNQPHAIYLAELLHRLNPGRDTLQKYRELVFETADCLASMVWFDPAAKRCLLGPPLWIYQELYDPATSTNPSFELAYWRWALRTAQLWRQRLGESPDPHWQEVIDQLSPLPIRDGKYVSLESHPDTWENPASRRDHPEMLMALGFLPEAPEVDRATMNRTLDAVLAQWDWERRIWATDYAALAMTATRLGRPEDALRALLEDAPNNRYLPNGHCPQTNDSVASNPGHSRSAPEIAVYLPANGSFLAAVALMVAGWDGCGCAHPGFPKDGRWQIRAEGWHSLP